MKNHIYFAEIKSTVNDCEIYYITGYLCPQVNKHTNIIK